MKVTSGKANSSAKASIQTGKAMFMKVISKMTSSTEKVFTNGLMGMFMVAIGFIIIMRDLE